MLGMAIAEVNDMESLDADVDADADPDSAAAQEAPFSGSQLPVSDSEPPITREHSRKPLEAPGSPRKPRSIKTSKTR